jgi:hypothetical protein
MRKYHQPRTRRAAARPATRPPPPRPRRRTWHKLACSTAGAASTAVSARGYQDFFAPSVGTAVPITTGLQSRGTVYMHTGALRVNVRFCRDDVRHLSMNHTDVLRGARITEGAYVVTEVCGLQALRRRLVGFRRIGVTFRGQPGKRHGLAVMGGGCAVVRVAGPSPLRQGCQD